MLGVNVCVKASGNDGRWMESYMFSGWGYYALIFQEIKRCAINYAAIFQSHGKKTRANRGTPWSQRFLMYVF